MYLDAFGVSENEVQDFRDNNVGLYGVDIERVSLLLLIQLTSALKQRVFNTYSVTDAIRYLEGLFKSRLVKPPKLFTYPPLNIFWKIHFSDARFIPRNLRNELGNSLKNSDTLEPFCDGNVDQEKSEHSTSLGAGSLEHAVTISAYKARADRSAMTGEWLIFGKYEEKNYYLAISKHSRTREGDMEIYETIKGCCENEFPFLFTSRRDGSSTA